MPRIRFLAVLVFLGTALCVTAQSIDPAAATVKLTRNETVLMRSLEEEIAVFEQFYQQQGLPFGDKERSEVLWRLIDLILFQQAAERDHVRVTDEHLGVAVEQYRQSLAARAGRQVTDAELRASVISEGMTWEEYLEKLRLNTTPEVYVAQTRAAALQSIEAPSDRDIRQYYNSNIQEFVIGDIVEFKHIYTATAGKSKEQQEAARRKIDEAYLKLRNGESFEALVVEYTEDTKTKNKGGYAGFLQIDKPALKQMYGASFIDAIFDVPEGQTSKVLQSTSGYHIVKIITRIPAKLYGLEDKTPPDYSITPEGAIRNALMSVKQQQALQEQLISTKLELRAAAEIRVIEKNLGFILQNVN